MKKRGMSTRIGAIILAASMVMGDAAPTLAAQQTNVDEDAVVSTELLEATEETESSETTETEEETEVIETTEMAEETEAVETTEMAEETETTEITETTEAKEETETAEITEAVEETEETEIVETTETEETEIVETTEAEETEVTETTETKEATEATEEAEEEDVMLGSEVGVSQVIGVEGEDSFDREFTSDDGSVTKEYEYVMSSADRSSVSEEDADIILAGQKADYLDAATG